MPALTAGKPAPEFTLPLMDGKEFRLNEALQQGPVVLAFFKISCPVCQFALPYIDRLHKAYKGARIVGVSQNDIKGTAAFVKEYGLTLPIALDDTKKYPVSNAYGLTNVPTVFLISPDGTIERSIVSWSRSELDELAQLLAERTKGSPGSIFKPGEDVPEFRAG